MEEQLRQNLRIRCLRRKKITTIIRSDGTTSANEEITEEVGLFFQSLLASSRGNIDLYYQS